MQKLVTALFLLGSAVPASAQLATKGDIDSLQWKLIDMEARLRALEDDKRQQFQHERQKLREQDAAVIRQHNADCAAYRLRLASGDKSAAAMDRVYEFTCKN